MDNITQTSQQIKSEIIDMFSQRLEHLFNLTNGDCTTNRLLEEETWKACLQVGALTLGALFTGCAQRIAAKDITARHLPASKVHQRMDKDYWAQVNTTFGPVMFPWYAYRQLLKNGASVTRNPALSMLFPAFQTCRSSKLCLEWETRLGSDHPFRAAQESLTYFTHGAVTLEDTTIARHMVRIGQMVTRDDMYKTPEEIRTILQERATRDRETHRPLLYVSSDAHALKRYVDDTWAAQWKMSNGIRLWCEDQKTGEVIHIGGEFTWGDCKEVGLIFQDLIARGILPSDGDYGQGVLAQLVWLSDGMPWFTDHILPLFSDVVVILDVYHLMQAFFAFIALCFKPKSKEAKNWRDRVSELTVGQKMKASKKIQRRRGHKKGTSRHCHHVHQRPLDPDIDPVQQAVELVKIIFNVPTKTKKAEEAQSRLFSFILSDPDRINYVTFRVRGYQIGSGAMESVHRIGSQIRLKLPGAKWLKHTSQAIFNIRMMKLAGNWNRFWNQPDIEKHFAEVKLPN